MIETSDKLTMNFWQNNERAREIFDELVKRADDNLYDDEFLELLGQYQEAGRFDCEGNELTNNKLNFEIFAARYLLNYGAYRDALEYGERAFLLRPMHLEVWKILATCYAKLGRNSEAIIFQGYMDKFYRYPIELAIKSSELKSTLDTLSVAMGVTGYAPFLVNRMFMEDGVVSARPGAFLGEYIPRADKDGREYFVGLYNEGGSYGNKAWLADLFRNDKLANSYGGAGVVFDIMRADKPAKTITVKLKEGEDVIAPVFGTEYQQTLKVDNNEVASKAYIDKWSVSYFRLDRTTTFTSKDDLVMAKPITLGHSSKRKKLVLNILVDALSYPAIKDNLAKYMPNVYEFFSEGVIFNNHFSIAEYTNNSLPTIELGMYPHNSQLYNSGFSHAVDKSYISLSERMQELGYHAVNILGGGDGIYMDITRGYDRLTTTPYELYTYEAVERAIRHIEAFDTDQFIFLHTLDVHPWSIAGFNASTATQTRLALKDRLTGEEEYLNSVFMRKTPVNAGDFWAGIANVDRAMGNLFHYIKTHYGEDEYVLTFYSDHGVSIFDDELNLCSEHQVGSMLMIRGAGVPNAGIVSELTSAVDIYPILARLTGFAVGDNVDGNLPAVFGGIERECVYSNSIFPGQTYKLAIRTKRHTMYLESREPVNEEGSVNLERAKIRICERPYNGKVERDLTAGEIKALGLREYFYPLTRKFASKLNNNGELFPEMRNARQEWYDILAEKGDNVTD